MDGEHLLLDLASGNPSEGEIQPQGYILQDIEPHKGIDLVCDLEELDKHIKQGQCKRIRMSHALEHFPTSHVPVILNMIHGLLEKDGEFEAHCPNLKWHCALILEDRDEEAVNYAFGGQRDKYDFHKTGFTPSILIRRLTEAGFKIVDLNIEHSIHILCIKV
jgi:predicted SAM-dependent methyltransferase